MHFLLLSLFAPTQAQLRTRSPSWDFECLPFDMNMFTNKQTRLNLWTLCNRINGNCVNCSSKANRFCNIFFFFINEISTFGVFKLMNFFLLATFTREHHHSSNRTILCGYETKRKCLEGSSLNTRVGSQHTSKRVTLSRKKKWKRKKSDSQNSLSQSLDIICSLLVFNLQKAFFLLKSELKKLSSSWKDVRLTVQCIDAPPVVSYHFVILCDTVHCNSKADFFLPIETFCFCIPKS